MIFCGVEFDGGEEGVGGGLEFGVGAGFGGDEHVVAVGLEGGCGVEVFGGGGLESVDDHVAHEFEF